MASSADPPEQGRAAGPLRPGEILHLDYRPAVAESIEPLADCGSAAPPRKQLRLLTVITMHFLWCPGALPTAALPLLPSPLPPRRPLTTPANADEG